MLLVQFLAWAVLAVAVTVGIDQLILATVVTEL
jgi:hypothetical protein